MNPLGLRTLPFGDLLVARHIPSKLGSALTPTSVPPMKRGRIEFLIKKGVKFYLCETALKKRGIYELYDKNMNLSSLSEFSKIISESDRVINL